MARIGGAALIALAVVITACDGNEAPNAGIDITVRDSAGTEIVDHVLGDREPPITFRLADSATATIGQAEGEDPYLFADIVAARLMSDGLILVVDGRAGELRWFGADGRHVRTVGRRGKGPGEFDYIDMVERGPGDTLVVYDEGNQRLTVVSPDGAIVRSIGTAEFRATTDNRRVDFEGALADGRAVGVTRVRRRDPPGKGLFLDSMVVWVVNRDGTTVDSIGALYRNQSIIREVHPTGQGFEYSTGEITFAPRAALAVGAEGIHYSPGRAWEISTFAPNGRPARIIRLERALRPVSDSVREAYRRFLVERASPTRRAAVEQRARDLIFADTLPAINYMLLDTLGRVWARQWTATAEEAALWFVFGEDGRLIGAATFPADCFPRDIGADRVLCWSRNELDVQRVEVRELVRVNP